VYHPNLNPPQNYKQAVGYELFFILAGGAIFAVVSNISNIKNVYTLAIFAGFLMLPVPLVYFKGRKVLPWLCRSSSRGRPVELE
jgi:hypothetical protein